MDIQRLSNKTKRVFELFDKLPRIDVELREILNDWLYDNKNLIKANVQSVELKTRMDKWLSGADGNAGLRFNEQPVGMFYTGVLVATNKEQKKNRPFRPAIRLTPEQKRELTKKNEMLEQLAKQKQ
tara:strand:- start:343 stop:720 length:378 start_codon:yes stop_codon:yes gene_type:complete